MSQKRFDAVLFDWDDTLCYADPHRFEHARDVARRFGKDHSLAEIRRAFVRADGYSPGYSHEIVQRLPAELGIPEEHHQEFFNTYVERDERKEYRLFDDVVEVMEHLTIQNVRVGVLSNNPDVLVRAASLAVEHHFELIISPDNYGISKPDPAIFLETLTVMDVQPERAIYVGDSYEDDIIGARAAGLTPVLIDRFAITHDWEDIDHRIESLHALDALLQRLVRGSDPAGLTTD